MGQGWHYGGLIGQKPIGFTGWTWANWTQEGTGFTLSSDNLTATKTVSGGTEGFYFEPSDIGGKRYFEVRMTQPSGQTSGALGTWGTAPPNTPNDPGAFTGTYGFFSASNGTLNTRLNVSGQSAVGSNFVFADPTDIVLCLAVDFDTGDVWMGGTDPGGTRYWVTSGQTTATTTFDPASPTATIPLSNLVSVMIRHYDSSGTITLRTTAVEHNAPSGFSLLGVDGTGTQLMRSSGVFGPSSMSAETGDDTGLEDAYATGGVRTVAGDGTAATHLDVAFGDSGNKLYVSGFGGSASYVTEYTLSAPYTVDSNASYVGETQIKSSAAEVYLAWKPDGTRLFFAWTNQIYQVPLSTAWSLSSAGTITSAATPNNLSPNGLAFKPDGTVAFLLDRSNKRISTLALSTPWDLSTLGSSFSSHKSLSGQVGSSTEARGLAVNADGTKFYYRDPYPAGNVVVRAVSCSTPYDIANATDEAATLDLSSYGNSGTSLGGLDVNEAAAALATVFHNPTSGSNNVRQFALVPTNKPTQRWGRQLGRSPFDDPVTLRNTGIITTPEAYQLKL